ncbi:MAG: hypothetical protein KTR30_20510 [Saprospiraceae bacterium]|nr:hypothetical protein [Saprospiraceae bacterium]
MTNKIYQQAIELIRKDETASAIELLLQQTHVLQIFHKIKLILLSSRLNRLQLQKIKGIIDPSQSAYQVRRNSINDDLLQWLEMARSIQVKPISWLPWILISTSLICFGAYLHFLQAPSGKFFVDTIQYQQGQLIIPLYKTTGTPEKLDLYFALTPTDSTYSLASPELSHLAVSEVATQQTLVADFRQWEKRQGIQVILSDPGRYEIKVPFSSGDKLDETHLRTCLSIYPSGKEGVITLSNIQWHEHLYFGLWPILFLLVGIVCTLGGMTIYGYRRYGLGAIPQRELS